MFLMKIDWIAYIENGIQIGAGCETCGTHIWNIHFSHKHVCLCFPQKCHCVMDTK